MLPDDSGGAERNASDSPPGAELSELLVVAAPPMVPPDSSLDMSDAEVAPRADSADAAAPATELVALEVETPALERSF